MATVNFDVELAASAKRIEEITSKKWLWVDYFAEWSNYAQLRASQWNQKIYLWQCGTKLSISGDPNYYDWAPVAEFNP